VDDLCRASDIEIGTLWVPRSHNVEADTCMLRRCGYSDDWSVHEWVFNVGPTHDRSFTTQKSPKLNSRFWCQGTAGVYAFKDISPACWRCDEKKKKKKKKKEKKRKHVNWIITCFMLVVLNLWSINSRSCLMLWTFIAILMYTDLIVMVW